MKNWTPVILKLLCPITVPADPKVPGSEDREIAELTFRPFLYGEYKDALRRVDLKDEDAVFEALALVATGETLPVIEQLKRPDYVSLSQEVHKYVTRKTEDYLGEPADPDAPDLLLPLAVAGQERQALRLSMPALKAVKVMKKLETADQRAEWITAHCTGLFPEDVRALSLPDWNQLQERINAFLNQPAAYFQNATSK
ncbi:phage tail assembly protein [Pseudomonas luteola]|uniref:phage tail assembly protein n=1 Tax=Pseudomonas luteola TaxID=47886 RepID=UPI0015E2C51E|nr:phage tail assembly protein [Pseudomonas zeshuii]MBA1250909.1 phage tail assembly protein [Pseudomonas zeshuii]